MNNVRKLGSKGCRETAPSARYSLQLGPRPATPLHYETNLRAIHASVLLTMIIVSFGCSFWVRSFGKISMLSDDELI